jgi:micrococcal nuclease
MRSLNKEFEYWYKARVVRIIDGDTLVVNLDLGLHFWRMDQHVRMLGINTPELNSSDPGTRERARTATRVLSILLPSGSPCTIQTKLDRDDKYGGRVGGWVYNVHGECINDMMIVEGHAVPFME